MIFVGFDSRTLLHKEDHLYRVVFFFVCHNTLISDSRQGIIQLDKLEFGGESPLTMRARCSGFRYCPNPLGIVPAE